jgi:SAM-dependent methyltransferase
MRARSTSAFPPSPAPTSRPCQACGGTATVTQDPWAFRCGVCGTWTSSLDDLPVTISLDEQSRRTGLEAIRRENFERVLDALGRVRNLHGARVLDVGAAHGWFVEAASRRGADAVGIEPDAVVAAMATERGLAVRSGWFPDDLPVGEQYDVIAFNDVFEHLRDPRAVLEQIRHRLRPGGCLLLSLPDAHGLGFRLARTLRRVGLRGPYQRLWQVGFPSPHLWYFSRAGLVRLLTDSGLRVAFSGSLPTLTRRGLWHRVHFERRPSVGSAVQWASIWLLAPVFNARPFSDAMLLLAVLPPAEEPDPSAAGPGLTAPVPPDVHEQQPGQDVRDRDGEQRAGE